MNWSELQEMLQCRLLKDRPCVLLKSHYKFIQIVTSQIQSGFCHPVHVVYPDDCAPLMKHLPLEMLICRLELLLTSVSGLDKDVDGQYARLALHLLLPWLTDHSNRQVRHLVAHCSTLLLSCYEADQIPYRAAILRTFLLFIIKELSQLRNPETFDDALDLMQVVFEQKTFLLATRHIYYDDICCSLLETLFSSFRDDNILESICQHSVDLMSQVIGGCAVISQTLLDKIFINMIKPFKTTNKTAYSVAVHLLRIRKDDLESRMISFFNDVLLERQTDSVLSFQIYPLLYEVVRIAPELLIDVLPKLIPWLKCDQVSERKNAVGLLAHVFSHISLNLVKEHSLLWTYFLDCFRDANAGIRCFCVSSSVDFFVYHQELLTYSPVGPTMLDHLKSRSYDIDSKVRLEFVRAVLSTLKCQMEVPDDLFDCLKKRTKDKDSDVRKASVIGLSKLFKRIYTELDASHSKLQAGCHTPTETITLSHLEEDDLSIRIRSSSEAGEPTVRMMSSPLEAEDVEVNVGVVDVDIREAIDFDNIFESEVEDLERCNFEETVDLKLCKSGEIGDSGKIGGVCILDDAGVICDLEMDCFSIHTSKSTNDEDLESGRSDNKSQELIEQDADDLMCDLSNKVDNASTVVGKSDSDKDMDDLEVVEDPYAFVGEDDPDDKQDLERVEEVEGCGSSSIDSAANDGGNLQDVEETDAVNEEEDFKEMDETITFDHASEFDGISEHEISEHEISEHEISEQEGDLSACSADDQRIEMLKKRLQMIGNAVLHGYRNQSTHDRLLIENMLYANLIPYSLSTTERLNRLLFLYSTLDDVGLRSFQEILKVEQTVRLRLRSVLEDDDIHLLTKDRNLRSESWMMERSYHSAVQTEELEEVQMANISGDYVGGNKVSEDRNRKRRHADARGDQSANEQSAVVAEANADASSSSSSSAAAASDEQCLLLTKLRNRLNLKIGQLLKFLPQPPVSSKSLIQLLSWPEVQGRLLTLVSDDGSCHKTLQITRTILEMCRDRRRSTDLYRTARVLLRRTAPVLVNMEGIVHLVTLLGNANVSGFVTINVLGKITADVLSRLLRTLSVVYSSCFQATEVYRSLLTFIGTEDVQMSSICLQVLANVGQPWLRQLYPEIHRELTQSLMSVMKSGAPEQIKYAVRCLKACNKTYNDLAVKILKYHLTNNWTAHCPRLLTALSAIRRTVKVLGLSVSSKLKEEIVAVVNGLLTSGNRIPPATKIEGMKLVVVVLLFGCDFDCVLAESFLSTLGMLLELDEEDSVSRQMSVKKRMAAEAGCCLMSLARNQLFDELITFDQFLHLAFLFNDCCDEVHQMLLQKLNKGLWTQRLSVRYLAVLSLVALSRSQIASKRIPAVRCVLQRNVERCRTYVNDLREDLYCKLPYILADYSIVYAVHLLAHNPKLTDHHHTAALKAAKKCLEFLMKTLLSGIHPSSFQFHKKLLEKVECSNDAQCPHDRLTTKKLYSVTDLALMVLQEEQNKAQRMLRRRRSIIALAPVLPERLLRQMTLEPHLPARLFLVQDSKMDRLSSTEAESSDSQLTLEVKSPDLAARGSVESTVHEEKERQEVEEAQEDRVLQESPAKRRRISERKSAKITDYFRIVSKSREFAMESGALLKDNQDDTESPQIPIQQQQNRGCPDDVRIIVFESEHSYTDQDDQDNGASDVEILA